MSPDVAIEEAKLKVTRSEKALEAMGDSSGAEVDCLQRAFIRQGPRGSMGTLFGGSNQRMPRIYQPGRASCREVGGRRCGREDHVGRRESTIESVGGSRRLLLQFTHQVGWPSRSNRSPHWCRSAMHSEPLPSQRRREVQ